MERTPDEHLAQEAANAIWFLEETERIATRNGWRVAAVGVSMALADMKEIASTLPPASPNQLPQYPLSPERRRR